MYACIGLPLCFRFCNFFSAITSRFLSCPVLCFNNILRFSTFLHGCVLTSQFVEVSNKYGVTHSLAFPINPFLTKCLAITSSSVMFASLYFNSCCVNHASTVTAGISPEYLLIFTGLSASALSCSACVVIYDL